MRLFRRRADGQHQPLHETNSTGGPEAAALLISMESTGSGSGTDGDQLSVSSRSERETLDDKSYQTVKALPAIVVINSPKGSTKNKGQFSFSCVRFHVFVVASCGMPSFFVSFLFPTYLT